MGSVIQFSKPPPTVLFAREWIPYAQKISFPEYAKARTLATIGTWRHVSERVLYHTYSALMCTHNIGYNKLKFRCLVIETKG